MASAVLLEMNDVWLKTNNDIDPYFESRENFASPTSHISLRRIKI